MSGRPYRGALHQRSDSETNKIKLIPSLHGSNPTVSQKATDVSTWVAHPAAASISRDTTRSSSCTTGSNSSFRPSRSIDSLPPVPPLKIYKKKSTLARDPTAIVAREAPDTNLSKSQTFPKSILKRPSQPALPPFTVEEYNQRSNSWVGSSPQSAASTEGSRMNSRTLRIVRSSEGDRDGEGEEINVVGGLVSCHCSLPLSPGVISSPQPGGESSAQGARMFPRQSVPVRCRSNASMERPGTANSLLTSAMQLPAWARYFYSRKGGRENIIESDMTWYGRRGAGAAGHRAQRQQSNGSVQINEVIPPSAAYHGPRHWVFSENAAGFDWVGSRTQFIDPEVVTQWSTPHLDHTPLSRFETIDCQLIMFCLGFILPICWIIASLLPLPEVHGRKKKQPHPATGDSSSFSADVEAGSNHTVTQERKHENAKWWRAVNRVMSVVGLLVIGAIIALGVIATVRSG